MRRLFIFAAVLCGLLASASAQQLCVVPCAPFGFQPLQIGGGGWNVGLDISNDGNTILFRTDTGGAYLFNKTTQTNSQIVTQASMPAANFGYYPTTGLTQLNQTGPGGVYEICSAPNSSSTIYLPYNGFVFKSTNRAQTFALTTFLSASTATSGVTASGNKTLNFSTTPAYAIGGLQVFDLTTPSAIPAETTVSSVTGTTAVMSLAATGAGVGSGDLIAFSVYMGPNDTIWRQSGRKCAVDPANANVFYLGTQLAGMYATYDGGVTFAKITGLPTSAGFASSPVTYPGYNIVIDPSSGTTTCPSGGGTCTKAVYVFAWTSTTAGAVYVSADGGSTWTVTTGGPTTMQHMVVGPTGGVVWATDATGGAEGGTASAWSYVPGASYAPGTWTKNTAAGASGWHSVAVNPNNVSNVILGSAGGNLNVSGDGGTSWTSSIDGGRACAAAQPNWQCWTNEFFKSNGDMVFDPSDLNATGGLYFGEGNGPWYTNPPTTLTAFNWSTIAAGEEQLISLQIIAPLSGQPVGGVLDRSSFKMTTNPSLYPATGNPVASATSLSAGYGLDYASTNPSYVFGVFTPEGFLNFDYSGVATDGGGAFCPFHSWITDAACLGVPATSSYIAKCAVNNNVCVTVPSTVGLTNWVAGAGSIISVVSLSGHGSLLAGGNFGTGNYPATVVDPTHVDLQNTTYSAGMLVPGNYLLYVSTNPLSDRSGLQMVTGTTNVGGVIQINFTYDGNSLSNGLVACVSGVTGTTEANGCWPISSPTSTSAHLVGSSYVNAWTGGGDLKTNIQPGGSIAASTPLNILRAPSNFDYPVCSQDGGQTWTTIYALGAPQPVSITNIVGSGTQVTFTLASSADIVTNATGRAITAVNSGPYNANYTITSVSNGGLTLVATSALTGSYPGGGTLLPTQSGWGTSYYDFQHLVAADRATPNVFYGYNYIAGLYQFNNCTPTQVNTGNTNTGSGYGVGTGTNEMIKTVPGQSGHLFFTAGPQGAGAAYHPATNQLWRSCNGGTTMQAVAGFFEPVAIGHGAPAPTKSYPAIYVVGWYSATNTRSTAIYGIYRSIDDPNNGVGGVGSGTTCTLGSNTWTKIGDYPRGWMPGVGDITADPSIYGQVYVNLKIGGFAYGYYPFLLKRDLSPANDNSVTPMFLNEAA